MNPVRAGHTAPADDTQVTQRVDVKTPRLVGLFDGAAGDLDAAAGLARQYDEANHAIGDVRTRPRVAQRVGRLAYQHRRPEPLELGERGAIVG